MWSPSFWTELVAALVVLLVALRFYLTSTFNYWKKRGVSGPEPVPLFGNFWRSMTGRISLGTECGRFYYLFKSKGYGGVFLSRRPVLVVTDPEIIKQVLTKDFSSVMDHGLPVEDDFLNSHLFNLNGEPWRYLRYKLAPTFTSGKIKLMVPVMKDCSHQLSSVLRKMSSSDQLEIRDLLSRFATDLISTIALGVESKSMHQAHSEFHFNGTRMLHPNRLFSIRIFLATINKKLAKLLPVSFIFPGMTDFYLNMLKDTVDYRKKNDIRRNDFVNLWMEIVAKDGKAKSEGQDVPMDFTDVNGAAQAFDFFSAGIDNLGNTVGFCLHEIALQPDVQNRLLEDVKSTIAKHDGELTYNAIQDMTYLDQVFNETLRKYTAGGLMMREVSAPEYQIPGTDITIVKGTGVFIPTQAMHKDPEIYPDPERFDPERFTEEAVSQRHAFTFLPFGEGPRFCIAKRFALLASKLAIAILVQEFRFSPCAKTAVPLKLGTGPFGPAPVGGFWLKVENRV